MPNYRLTALIRVVLVMTFTVAIADRAAAASIVLSNLVVQVDQVGLTVTVTAGLEAKSGNGSDVFLDTLAVSLFQDGVSIDDLLDGPPVIDFDPFFDLPLSLPDDGVWPVTPPWVTPLFRITGLVPSATYTGSFELFQSDQVAPLVSRSFDFTTGPVPVPEPATLLFTATGLGATGWLGRRRRWGLSAAGRR